LSQAPRIRYRHHHRFAHTVHCSRWRGSARRLTFTDNGNGTGTLSGTPAAGHGGTYNISFTASNGIGANAVQNFTLTVNQAPAITSGNATTLVVETAGSFTVATTGFPAPALTLAARLCLAA
jgi:hypothetical protein